MPPAFVALRKQIWFEHYCNFQRVAPARPDPQKICHMLFHAVTAAERSTVHEDVERHWEGSPQELSIIERIARAVAQSGRDWSTTGADGVEILAPLDEFHCFGRSGTDHMARMCRLASGMKILDVGCGIGGPARRLVKTYGCQVHGIDVTHAYVDAGKALNRHFGFGAEGPWLRWGDAIELPFEDGTFDVVWVQVATAGIQQRARFFAEASRVLVPGGQLAMLDIQAGEVQPLKYPVAWAKDDSTNAILTAEATRRLIKAAGLELTVEQDVSAQAEQWCRSQADAYRSGEAPPIGFHLLHAGWAEAVASQAVNLSEGRLRFAYLLAGKPG